MENRSLLIEHIDFGPIWAMSGLLNFYGQGWPYHKVLKTLGVNFRGVTLVSKTTTLYPRGGNLPLNERLMPQELIPDSIHINWRHKCALNAISLSGPGAKTILTAPELHNYGEPLQLSFMSVERTKEERLQELKTFVVMLCRESYSFQNPIAVQLNISCPNTGHETAGLDEAIEMLDICDSLAERNIPVIPKISVEMPTSFVMEIGRHDYCSALCTSNTVKFGNLPSKIDWKKLYPHGSPLAKRALPIPGAGGLSGAPLLPLVVQQIKDLRKAGFKKHINGGGGILSATDAQAILNAGADSISLGSIAFLRPFEIPKIIRGFY